MPVSEIPGKSGRVPKLQVTGAGSNGRCNTGHCVDSRVLPLKNQSVWSCSIKTQQSSVPADLTPARDFSLCFSLVSGFDLSVASTH